MSEYTTEREFGWDDEIQNDGNPFQVLPEGDYTFDVEKFERARQNATDKMPACNKAVLTLSLSNAEAKGTLKTNLFLHSRYEWKLCQFFKAIGQRQHGEAMRMNWNAVPGASGTCRVETRPWKDRSGKEREGNEIAEFYDPQERPVQPPEPPTPGASSAPGGYTPGQF